METEHKLKDKKQDYDITEEKQKPAKDHLMGNLSVESSVIAQRSKLSMASDYDNIVASSEEEERGLTKSKSFSGSSNPDDDQTGTNQMQKRVKTYSLGHRRNFDHNGLRGFVKRRSTLSGMLQVNQNFENQHHRVQSRSFRRHRLQMNAYKFLERPTGVKCFVYHVLVFLLVLICLIFSVLSTIEEQKFPSDEPLVIMESILVAVFSIEYIVRLWSAGSVSKYRGVMGRLRFAKKPICVIDFMVVCSSMIILLIGRKGNVFAASAIRGIRFLQIVRMLHVDRQGGTWRLLGSVVYVHRQELITTLYIGFLALIFSSYFVYLAEQPYEAVTLQSKGKFSSYADALWWGVITVTTIGYGDYVPTTWLGKIIASCFSVFAISFFALPAGILGSGFALKVQQNQRQKQFNRQIPAAARFIQASWRLYATSEGSRLKETWRIYAFLNRHKDNDKNVGAGFVISIGEENIKTSQTASSVPSGKHRDGCGTQCGIGAMPLDRSTLGSHNQSYIRNNRFNNYHDKNSDPHMNVVRASRKLIYFAAKKRFQVARRPYDVRDVAEQYSQGNANIMMKIKELQRRLDQTLGRPSSYNERGCLNSSPSPDRQRFTAGARLQRLEKWAAKVDNKLDNLATIIQRIEGKINQTNNS